MVRLVSLALIFTLAGPPMASPQPALSANDVRTLAAGATVALQLDGTIHQLSVRPVNVLSGAAEVTTTGADGQPKLVPRTIPTTYRSTQSTSVNAALTIRGTSAEGIAVTPSGTWLLTPHAGGGSDISRVELAQHDAAGSRDGIVGPVNFSDGDAAPTDTPLVARLAIEVDQSFYAREPGQWEARVTELVNYLNVVYSQINVTFRVDWLNAWTIPDPYSSRYACGPDAPDGVGKLEQLSGRWNTEPALVGVPRDAVHLLTASLDGAFIGCANVKALNNSSAFGVSRLKAFSPSAAVLTDSINTVAHELGHNFGGVHERSIGAYGATGTGMLSQVPPYTIMNPVAEQGVLRFSDLTGVSGPGGNELDNATPMRQYAQTRLGPA